MPPRTHDITKLSGLASRFAAYVAERYPFALHHALDAFESAGIGAIKGRDAVKQLIEDNPELLDELEKRIKECLANPEGKKVLEGAKKLIEEKEKA